MTRFVFLLFFVGLSSFANSAEDLNNYQIRDSSFNLAKLLLEQDYVFVPAGNHYISKTIVVKSFKKIVGVVGKSKLIAAPGFAGTILELNGVSDVEISGISFEGNQRQFSKSSNICSSRDSIRKFEGRTSGIGISISNGTRNCWINTCDFKYFGEAALKMRMAGGRQHPVSINAVSISKSYCGIDNFGTEYSPANLVSITDCVFGLILDAGNQYFSACSFNDNRIGVYLGSTNGNNSHGVFSACNFNHSGVYSIFSDGIDFGETFVGCMVGDGDIFLENTNGFIFNGGMIDAQIFVKGGNTNVISNTGFLNSYGGGKIYQNFEGSRSRLLLKNNFFMQEKGENDSKLNN